MDKYTFISTILFGSRQTSQCDSQESVSPASSRPRLSDHSKSALRLLQPSSALPGPLSTQIKQKIWWYAGVRSGERWRVIEAAANNLGIKIASVPSGGGWWFIEAIEAAKRYFLY